MDVYPYDATDEAIIRAEAELQLVPSSMEGVTIERKQSNNRIESIQSLHEYLSEMSVWAAEAVTQYILDNAGDSDLPKEYMRQILVVQNAQVIGIGVQSIIANLLEAGVLEYKKG